MKKTNRKYIYILSILLIILTSGIIWQLSVSAFDVARAENLYVNQCANCHRKDGTGVKRVYPPLKNADYIRNGNTVELLRGMLFGRSGRIVVNGYTYNGVMTTEIDNNLSDNDIALILNYVYVKLNDITDRPVTEKDVKEARKLGKLPPHK
ncbi:MAG: cytochrome c [Candidatus Kapabacteria bacterium]|nr:cytochrome c [Candidatus Kapabacteria bacterium]